MSYKVIIVKYTCDCCGKDLVIEHKEENYANPDNYPSLEINCPIGWDWHSPAQYSKNKHYCKTEYCQNKNEV